jgi:hypothetical protein
VHVKLCGHRFVEGGQELLELDRPVAAVQLADDRAAGAMLNAANRLVMPCRR